MIISLSDLANSKAFKKEIHMCYEREPIYFEGDKIEFVEPICAHGTLSLIEDVLQLKLKVSTEVRIPCSRCLEFFNYPLEFHMDERISNEDVEDDEVLVVNGDNLDITEMLENSIIMELPTKKLCNEDCKGLCQQCGINLNKSSCKCDNFNVDPRLAKLKDMFFTE